MPRQGRKGRHDKPKAYIYGNTIEIRLKIAEVAFQDVVIQMGMRVAKTGLLMGVFFATALASAAVPEGRWNFERAGDFEGRIPANQQPPFPAMEFSKNEVSLSASCVAMVTSEPYYFPDVFQPLTKQGISAKQMDYFLMKHFHLALAGTKEIYSLDSAEKCGGRRTTEFFVIGDRILVVTGITFYSYVKVPAAASTGQQGTIASV